MSLSKRDSARLAVARHAAVLFWQHGVDATSGDAIAAAAGLSKRTVWRYFRSKEACVEPLFLETSHRFVTLLHAWPHAESLETYLHRALPTLMTTPQDIQDGVAAARLVSRLSEEPALQSAYLMASAQAEVALRPLIADRTGRACTDIEVRLCAAVVLAAVRVIDEDIASAAIQRGERIALAAVIDRLAAAIRTASTLPFCDPVGGPDNP